MFSFGRGIKDDVLRRWPLYASDFVDGKTIKSPVFHCCLRCDSHTTVYFTLAFFRRGWTSDATQASRCYHVLVLCLSSAFDRVWSSE